MYCKWAGNLAVTHNAALCASVHDGTCGLYHVDEHERPAMRVVLV